MIVDQIQVWHNGQQLTLPRSQCHFIDRTRVNVGQQCQMKRFVQYNAGPEGRGLVSAYENEDLALGKAVHEGLEYMLMNPDDVDITNGAEIAYRSFKRSAQAGLTVQGDPFMSETFPEAFESLVEEQAWLAYALVWTFGRRRLPGLLNEFEVVAVEPEIAWLLSNGEGWNESLVMMSRPDAILRHRTLGRLWTVSWKTTKRFTSESLEKLESDTQTLTEGLAVQHRFGEECAGSYYGYFVKGSKDLDKDLGFKRYSSPLIRPYCKTTSVTFNPDDLKAAYEWFDGERSRKLGTTFKRVNMWEMGGIQEWLADLDSGQIQPEAQRDWLSEAVVEPARQLFDPAHAERWVRSTIKNEVDNWLTPDPASLTCESGSCFAYRARCFAYDHCWRGKVLGDYVAEGRWKVREANHEDEFSEEE